MGFKLRRLLPTLRSREERPSRMVLTVTEDTPADMLAGSMELLVQLPLDHHVHTQKVTVLRSTPMMDLLVQIATAHKLTASSYTLQAIGERGLVLPHHPNTPIGALDALQVKLLPKQGTCVPRKTKQTNQPFETTFRLQVHLPRNQLYVSRVSPKMNLGEILDEVCREKNLDRNKYELRHPANLEETLDLALSLQDYHLQEVTLYAKQARTLGPTLSTQDIMALQRQEERRRQQTKQSVFGFMFKKSKESSLSTDSLGGRSVSPARSDETGRSASPLQPPARPQRKRRPAPKPPTDAVAIDQDTSGQDGGKDKMVINHSRNSSDSSGYHEASVLSDNPDSAARLPETLPRRSKAPGMSDTPRKLAQTSQSSKSLGNLAVAATTAAAAAATMMTGGGTLTRGISSTSLSSTGLRKKRAAPPPPAPRPLSSAISTQALERIVDSEESLTSDMDPSKPPSDIGAPSKASSDIDCPKANSDIGISTQSMRQLDYKPKAEVSAAAEACKSAESDVPQQSVQPRPVKSDPVERKLLVKADPDVPVAPVEAAPRLEQARVAAKRAGEPAPLPTPRKINAAPNSAPIAPKVPKRKVAQPPLALPRTFSTERDSASGLSREEHVDEAHSDASSVEITTAPSDEGAPVKCIEREEEAHFKSRDKCAPSDGDKSSQRRRKLSETISDVTVEHDASLRSRQSHEMESDVESDSKSTEPTHVEAEKRRSESEHDSPREDETRRDKRTSNIVGDAEDLESLNLNEASSCHDADAKCESNSILAGQRVSSTSASSLEVTSERQEGHLSSAQGREAQREDENSRGENENQRARAYAPPEDDSLNESATRPPDHVAEELKRVEQPRPLHRGSACPERPPRSPRKTVSIREKSGSNVETAKYVHPEDATTSDDAIVKSSILGRDRETCSVISTIPKCEHLDAIKEHGALASLIVASTDHHQHDDEHSQVKDVTAEECEKQEGGGAESHGNEARSAKRPKVIRSQSKSDDFQMNALKRQRRYFTSPPEDIVYALNLNLPETRNSMSSHAAKMERQRAAAARCTNGTRDVDVDKGESRGGLVTATKDNSTPSETDILLQKVSDTLSNVLPSNSSSPEPSLQLERTNSVPMRKTNDVADMDTKLKPCNGSKDQSNEISKSSYVDFPADTLSSSTPNMTSNLQQDTSDYVSAMSEDLSISDWEYQLPAPPSAFRDSHSPVFDDYDTVTLGSVEAFKESLVTHPGLADTTDSCSKNDGSKKRKLKSLLNNVDANYNTTKATTEKIDSVPEAELNDDVKRATDKQTVAKQAPMSAAPKSEANADPRKEMISELENKIENGTLAQNIGKDLDRRNIDNVSAPKIAPVDNTLSNFTITTYTKQKNLDIFDEFEESDYVRNSDERFIKTFATLSRNNAGVGGHESKSAMRDMGRLTNGVSSHDSKVTVAGKNAEEPSASNVADCKTEPKIRNHDEPANNRWQCLSTTNNERANNVQRSKSYISTTNNAKYQTESQAMSERKHDPRSAEPPETAAMKKATSTSSLNVDAPRVNEKFSQWRDNILKRQEECTKEKQLQSLQVLKSILPQLKNAQQAEENVSKEYNNGLSIEKTKYEAGSNEHSSKTNVVLTRESRDTEATECRQPSREESTKRYTYAGPPAISLGSWSERPSVNVQIKMDTDYKLGRSNTSGNKTVVNINGAKEEKDIVNYTNNNISSKHHIAKHDIKIDSKNRDELSQKSLITHTMTLSGFKKPLSCRVNTSVDSIRTNEDRPVVTGVELKKSFVEVKETPRNVESEIDTTPVNFRELTKTFGQHVNFKLKPKRANINRHSADYHGAQLEETDAGVKQNGHGKFARMNNENESLPYKGQPLTSGAQQNCRLRKFTSVVGVNGTGQSFNQQNETVVLRSNVNNNAKINPLMPVVKGFKISVNDSKTGNGQLNQNGLSAIDGSKKNAQLPKPPTMPVITGVTLKSTSTRPKSMPAQMDPRDMLLESIRNFGGRDKLKSAAERF
ncbi:uncharacterized protein LOC105186705 isoform X3 [Harpegnathos saltator]|uniref:uncharacterized protein LOC105186705 isoform X3 n=1 Tax=Harpegnathos saltator TaxID=610380 RepID=UPI000DBEF0F6|nr:uncharacterized protein LOC105186705 isoform X3 [Harpegnathos saltator]